MKDTFLYIRFKGTSQAEYVAWRLGRKVEKILVDEEENTNFASRAVSTKLLNLIDRQKICFIIASSGGPPNVFEVKTAGGRMAFRVWLVMLQYQEELAAEANFTE